MCCKNTTMTQLPSGNGDQVKGEFGALSTVDTHCDTPNPDILFTLTR